MKRVERLQYLAPWYQSYQGALVAMSLKLLTFYSEKIALETFININ